MRKEPVIYLDHGSTTPVDPVAVEAMAACLRETFGNPASIQHEPGQRAAAAQENSAVDISAAIGGAAKDLIFTSGATESINLALRGCMAFYRDRGRHMVVGAADHPAVLETAAALRRDGCEVTILPVEGDGTLCPERFAAALRDDTVIASATHANNELGSIQELGALGTLTRKRGVLFHVDAAQSFGKLAIDVEADHIDLLSCSAHKLYGPKGVGALYLRRRNPRVRLVPQLSGGGQQRGLRSGTLNVPGIAGFAAATRRMLELRSGEGPRLTLAAKSLFARLESAFPLLRLLGHPDRRLPGQLSLNHPGLDAQQLLCDCPGLAFSMSSACHSDIPLPSRVMLAIGLTPEQAASTFRLHIGRFNEYEELERASRLLIAAMQRQFPKSP